MIAAICGSVDAIRLLKPLELNLRNNNQDSALILAAFHNQFESAKLLIEEAGLQQIAGFSALSLAVSKGNTQFYNLLKNKEDDLVTKDGRSLLMIAAETK